MLDLAVSLSLKFKFLIFHANNIYEVSNLATLHSIMGNRDLARIPGGLSLGVA
jgi:hypothetical protein